MRRKLKMKRHSKKSKHRNIQTHFFSLMARLRDVIKVGVFLGCLMLVAFFLIMRWECSIVLHLFFTQPTVLTHSNLAHSLKSNCWGLTCQLPQVSISFLCSTPGLTILSFYDTYYQQLKMVQQAME